MTPAKTRGSRTPARQPSKAKRRAERWGRLSEMLCALWLRLKGYRILGRNLRTPEGEIDILARRGQILAVIEVKSRSEALVAGEAVTAAKQRRLLRAARYLMGRMPDLAGFSIRFDAMLISRRGLSHVIDAWRDEAP
jgi:putative endonuclease